MRHRLPLVPTLLGIGVVATLMSLLSTSNQLGSIPCVGAAGLLGLSIARWMERRGASRPACIATIVVSMVNPLTWEALALGHPEELLGGALCVGAVLAALRGRSTRAALLLGLAAALTAPFVASNLSLTNALIVALVLALSAAWWFSPRRTPDDALALLALLFLVRCVVDPVDNASHHVPFLLSLLAWEGLVRRRLPLVSILTSATIYFAIGNDFYLAAILPVATWLALTLYLPRRTVARSPLASSGPFPATAGPSR
jgi:hypothetical protein